MITPSPDQWLARGHYVALPETRVFVVDGAGHDAGALPVIALHGFPTSSWDWAAVAALAATRGRRFIAADAPGFGRTETAPDAACSIFDQADAVVAVARAAGVQRAHLWAHDMGTSVVTELLARRELGLACLDIASVVLMNGGVHVEMSRPALGQRLLMSAAGPWFARLTSRRLFTAQLARVFGRRPSPAVLDAMWTLTSHGRGIRRLPTTIRFMRDRPRFARRWLGALARIDRPLLVAWGGGDPVTHVGIAHRLAREVPGARLVTWDDLGHYPHVEDAPRVWQTVDAFLNEGDGAASGGG